MIPIELHNYKMWYKFINKIYINLLDRGVLIQNKRDRDDLMSPTNINKEEMYRFAIDAAEYSTESLSEKLPTQESKKLIILKH